MGRERAFLGTSALVFLASSAAAIHWCGTMSGGLAMPGGWTMSMVWMRMPGQAWLGAAASFLGTWVTMMVAMMLPSLVPVLSRYRRSLRGPAESRLAWLTALAGAGYFTVWAVYGGVAYTLGVVLTAAEVRWSALARVVPFATSIVLLLAGSLQLTAWKARQLGRCWDALACDPSPSWDARSTWQRGLRLGVHCSLCCSGFMMVLLVTGLMNLAAMVAVAGAITVERVAPRPEYFARAAGVVVIAAGALLLAHRQ